MRTEQIGDATLYLGDCLEILPTLQQCSSLCAKGEKCSVTTDGKCDAKKIDAVVTDPPYGINATKFCGGRNGENGWAFYEDFEWDKTRPSREIFDAIRACSLVQIIWGGNYFTDYLPPSMQWLSWDKGQDGFSLADFELAWSSQNKAARRINYPRALALKDGKQHQTQKPIAVMKWCIEQINPPPQTILDPFMGSGTTGVACAQLGRKFIGIEINEPYFDIACRRIEDAYRQKPLFEEPKTPVYEQPELKWP